ncbi:PKD domain-containing protein [Fulvivirga sp.]|uniref:PKD domain-containing protein n=1 Tax=Fulvivirga sp. TaxID=1931237 RepID=UPI0032ECD848
MKNLYRWLLYNAIFVLSTGLTFGQISSYPHSEGFEGSFSQGTNVEFLPNWFGSFVMGDTIYQETEYFRSGSAALGITPPGEEFILYVDANLDLTGIDYPYVEFWAASKDTGGEKSVRLYVSVSGDGGVTWSPQVQIGDNTSFPNEDTPYSMYSYAFNAIAANQPNAKFRFIIKGGIKKEPVAQLVIDDVEFKSSDADIFPPVAVEPKVITPDTLRVIFSEPVSETAELTANYIFSPAVNFSSIERTPTQDTVYIYLTEPLENGVTYALTVQNVEDLNGNVMLPQEFELIYNATISGLVISEIFYDEPPVEMNDNLEFIELYNATTTPLALGGIQIKEAIFSGPLPAYTLQPGEYYILTKNLAAFKATFGFDANYEWTASNLENTGNEFIELLPADHHAGFLLDSVMYQITEPWPTTAAGTGKSIEICNKFDDNALGENWLASELQAGTSNGFTIYATPGQGCNSDLNPVVDLGDDTDYCGITSTNLNAGNEGALILWSTGETTNEIVVSASGTYSVVVNNGYGAATDMVEINFYPALVADVQIPESPQCSNESLSFTDNTNDAVSWLWSFGDGSSATLQNPTHTYTSAGDYEVTLLVTAATGCTDLYEGVLVVSGVEPTWNLPETPVCLGETIEFTSGTSTDVDAVEWLWDFGDGETSTLQNPSHTYAETGFYDIILLVTSELGCQNTLTGQIHITKITANWEIPQSELCANEPNYFQAEVENAYEWLWDFGDGNISDQEDPEHAYANVGTYTVRLQVTSPEGCMDEITDEVVVTDITANWNIPQNELCVNEANMFQANVQNAAEWHWDFGDGNTANLENAEHAFANGGTYTVRLRVTSQFGCTDEIEQEFIVGGITANWTIPNQVLCANVENEFRANATNAHQWHWDFGDGNTSNNENPSYSFAEAGTYTIRLQVTSQNGCIDEIVDEVTVADITSEFNVPTDPLCANVAYNFNAAVGTDWAWDFGDGHTSHNQNVSHKFTEQGRYTVTLQTTSQYGCKDIITADIDVSDIDATWELPEAVCYQNMVNFRSTNQEAVSSMWNFGNGVTSSEHDFSHTFTEVGPHNVSLTVVNAHGCEDEIEAILEVDVCVGLDADLSGEVSLYPNPNNGAFQIALSKYADDAVDIKIYNQSGVLVYNFDSRADGQTNKQITVQNLKSGLYVVKMRIGNTNVSRKILIQ